MRDPVSHQCPKTRSDALGEATQTRHAERPDHYLCDTVEQLFTHLSSLGVKWSQVAVGRAHTGSPVAMCCERIGSARPWPTDHRRPRAALMAPGAPDNPPPAHPRSWSPAEGAAVAACCVVNGFVNETRRIHRDGVTLGVMPRPGESA